MGALRWDEVVAGRASWDEPLTIRDDCRVLSSATLGTVEPARKGSEVRRILAVSVLSAM